MQEILVSLNNYGFYGNLPTDGDKNYNFYAEGSAPNYFRGVTSVGANTISPGWDFTSGSDGIRFTTGGSIFSRNSSDAAAAAVVH